MILEGISKLLRNCMPWIPRKIYPFTDKLLRKHTPEEGALVDVFHFGVGEGSCTFAQLFYTFTIK
jgi:hypothetical protein